MVVIFDLDGTLADCEHRWHFVDAIKAGLEWGGVEGNYRGNWTKDGIAVTWKPDWKSFYDACDKDMVIIPVAFQFYSLRNKFGALHPIEIWSGRCESVKGKTIEWLQLNFTRDINWVEHLKMRPLGDSTPDEILKERWLNERCPDLFEHKPYPTKHEIDFVFDSDPKSISMWKRRGIFVFNCCQHDEEF